MPDKSESSDAEDAARWRAVRGKLTVVVTSHITEGDVGWQLSEFLKREKLHAPPVPSTVEEAADRLATMPDAPSVVETNVVSLFGVEGGT